MNNLEICIFKIIFLFPFSMKILITSDTHLGYKEHDTILSLDSFRAFEEVLKDSIDCDFMIHGGDLFHSNKPSRFTMYKTVNILRKYCLGDKNITFRASEELNYTNADLNVSLPILVINGNHDDPCGYGSLSALDILHEILLVNYVGKNKDLEKIIIEPIIFEKEKKVAIYFLSHVRDKRLYRLFTQKKIIFKEAKADMHILVIHQNVVERTGADFIKTEFIPPFFNLIILGHEHNPILFERNNQTYLQCGSSVRTSCCDAEFGPKYYYKLEIGNIVRIEKFKLKSVRPFIFDTINVDDNHEITKKLNEMISSAEKCFNCKEKENFCKNCLPLIRLRLKTSLNINKLPFQSEFNDKVANPGDMLLIIKKNKIEYKQEKISKKLPENFNSILLSLLKKSDLKILPEYYTAEKINEFVEKENKNAIDELVDDIMKYPEIKEDGIENDIFESVNTNEDEYFNEIKEYFNNKVTFNIEINTENNDILNHNEFNEGNDVKNSALENLDDPIEEKSTIYDLENIEEMMQKNENFIYDDIFEQNSQIISLDKKKNTDETLKKLNFESEEKEDGFKFTDLI